MCCAHCCGDGPRAWEVFSEADYAAMVTAGRLDEEFRAHLRDILGYKIGDRVYAPEDVIIIRRADHGGYIEATT